MFVLWEIALNRLYTGVWDIVYYSDGSQYSWEITEGVLYRGNMGVYDIAPENYHTYRDTKRFTNIKGERL